MNSRKAPAYDEHTIVEDDEYVMQPTPQFIYDKMLKNLDNTSRGGDFKRGNSGESALLAVYKKGSIVRQGSGDTQLLNIPG